MRNLIYSYGLTRSALKLEAEFENFRKKNNGLVNDNSIQILS